MRQAASSRFGGDRRSVLVVDDDPHVRTALLRWLSNRRIDAVEAGSAAEALEHMRRAPVDMIISDQALPLGSGVELLERVRERWPETARILMAEGEDPAVVRDAINRAGVCYLLEKPWDTHALDEILPADDPHDVRVPASAFSPLAPITASGASSFPYIVGRSAAMRDLLDLVVKVAQTNSTVLVTGETGTGKELIGRAIHESSVRRHEVFSAVNSAAFPETLLESELFGHRRGAFTGATQNSKGLFESAHKGTVFLDEVAEMPLSMQAKLLRFLQTGEIRPVGHESTRFVNVRLVTATNKGLEEEVAAGRFREDLYYRLAVIPIHVPALRERIEDLPELAQHFLRRIAKESGGHERRLDDAALATLMAYDWPGNVRQLENLMERCVALTRGEWITARDLPGLEPRRARAAASRGFESLPTLERRHIIETLDRVGWNRKRAAEILQISTTTLWRRLKEFGIEGPRATSRIPLGG